MREANKNKSLERNLCFGGLLYADLQEVCEYNQLPHLLICCRIVKSVKEVPLYYLSENKLLGKLFLA